MYAEIVIFTVDGNYSLTARLMQSVRWRLPNIELFPSITGVLPDLPFFNSGGMRSNHRLGIVLSTIRLVKTRVSDGARTRDIWNHNPALYQLSYTHRVWADFRAANERRQLAMNVELQDVRILKWQR